MIYQVKRFLYKLLPESWYLLLLHRGFYFLLDIGALKKDKRFKYHYFVRKLIRQDDTVVDIGANLGYFSRQFARSTRKGKLISIEPVPAFHKVLTRVLRRYPQVQIHHCALGSENGELTMVFPETRGVMRTGLPHVKTDKDSKADFKQAVVKVRKGSELLHNEARIDYIKCDIEGYEAIVFTELLPLLSKHLPIIQLEIAEQNTEEILQLLSSLGYKQYGLADFKLIPDQVPQTEQGDFLFVHPDKIERISHLL